MARRIMVIFGTRPEAIKLFPVIAALNEAEGLEPIVLVTGQHREMLDQVLEIAGLVPDHDLALMQPGQSLDEISARLLTGIGGVLDAENPDMVIVQGDTATAMCGALAAYYRKIPVAHVEAGLRSGNIYHPWPEEVNRKIIGGFADLHFAPTETAANALRREAVADDKILVTGNTVIDALHWVTAQLADDPARASVVAPVEARFAGKRIIGVTTHRRENFGSGMDDIAHAIRDLAGREDVAIIFPVHLNPQVRAAMLPILGGLDNVALLEPLDYLNFTRLLQIAELMLTDSGGVQEEAPALGKPVLVMRDTTERPEGVAAGTARLVGTDRATIVTEATRLLDDASAYAAMAQAHNPFGDGHSAGRIADAIARWFATTGSVQAD
ncbi:non-hydrolyzing UDP-N-acetylglucosamine 2-epimerase [Sphingomonas sp. 35-24ZXX]|uniref:non-hydrolyzing UDP-N-acetylglucosamine 2-epimerase n=1 Tax=Sphingomonas sp. 35-24ZXX TaxID=1545915 RepID=UPI00053BF7A7|nr:UDP-N-acetylglucosamine 2-epimerase (non-hydrolyzing) [Sphingomonas sp. 35-24ZXX]